MIRRVAENVERMYKVVTVVYSGGWVWSSAHKRRRTDTAGYQCEQSFPVAIIGDDGFADETLRSRALSALLVAAGCAAGADDNHATTLAAVLEGRHIGDWLGLTWKSGKI